MRSVFTEYVRSLSAGADPSGARLFRDAWSALRKALVAEMKKRGLWSAPPTFLGVYGWRSWSEGPEPLEDLLADCYTYVFIDRLRSLTEHVRLKTNVEGLVFLSVRHFLHDTQKRHDPLGYRVFTVLEAAVRGLLARGVLKVAGGPARIRNETLLAFADGPLDDTANPVPPGARTSGWADALLPELVTAQGQSLQQTVARVEGLVASLAEAGVRHFVFRDLIDPLKQEIRSRWMSMLNEKGEGDLIETDAEVGPPRRADALGEVEERDNFEKLLAGVDARIEALGEPEATKRDLRRLLGLLGRGAGAEDALSQRRVATLLDVSRDRVALLYRILGGLIGETRLRMGAGRAPRRAPVAEDKGA